MFLMKMVPVACAWILFASICTGQGPDDVPATANAEAGSGPTGEGVYTKPVDWITEDGLWKFYPVQLWTPYYNQENLPEIEAASGPLNAWANETLEENVFDGSFSAGPVWFSKLMDDYVQAKMTYPDTKGTVRIKLKAIRLSIASDAPVKFAIDVNNSDDPTTGTWTRVLTATNTSGLGADKAQQFTIPSEPEFKWVRLVNKQGSWMNVHELECLGDIVQDEAASDFKHPGTLWTRETLDLLRSRLDNNNHPAGVTWGQMHELFPAASYTPNAVPLVLTNTTGARLGEAELDADSRAAFENAIMWGITGNTVYADNIKVIAEDWVNTCTEFRDDAALHLGVCLPSFLYALEMTKYTSGSGWNDGFDHEFLMWLVDANALERMEQRLRPADNNWTQMIIRSHLALSVLIENRYHFNRMIDVWKRNIEGNSVAYGETNETCRDIPHAMMGINGLGSSAEIAYSQGVDLYGWKTPEDDEYFGYRLANILNYHANINNTGSAAPPVQDLTGFQETTILGAVGHVDRASGMSEEVVYNHYKSRLGIELPAMKARIDYTRNDNQFDGFFHASGWGSITHAENSEQPTGISRGDVEISSRQRRGRS